jgi:hypothetical protein
VYSAATIRQWLIDNLLLFGRLRQHSGGGGGILSLKEKSCNPHLSVASLLGWRSGCQSSDACYIIHHIRSQLGLIRNETQQNIK